VRRVTCVVALMLAAGCSTDAAAPTTTTPPAPSSTASTTSTSTIVITTTTTTTATTTTTVVVASGAPTVDMVPAGDSIDDFIPLVLSYFAVRNWALEHPDEATETILATVIEPGSPEMKVTLDEIRDLLDHDAHYEGLTETFELFRAFTDSQFTDVKGGTYAVLTTIQYGDSSIVSQNATLSSNTLRRAGWTIDLGLQSSGEWLIVDVFRNPFEPPPSTP